MLRRLLLLIIGSLTAACMQAASADIPDTGQAEFMFRVGAVFTNGSAYQGRAGAYYDTNSSHTDYDFSGGLGFGLPGNFETGVSVGFGHLSGTVCNGATCGTESVGSRQWSLFIRHNFERMYDDTNFAFSGIEMSTVYPDSTFGRITVVRPYVGYRFGLQQDWSLELSVGGAQVVAGTTQVSSGYEVRLGLVIPLH